LSPLRYKARSLAHARGAAGAAHLPLCALPRHRGRSFASGAP
jgi:hypothetical protein